MATPAAAGASLLVRQYFTSTTKAFWLGMIRSINVVCVCPIDTMVLNIHMLWLYTLRDCDHILTHIILLFYLGACNPQYPSCRSFVPSGVLVKALMLNSGTAQTLYHGGGAKDVPLGKHNTHCQHVDSLFSYTLVLLYFLCMC